jgi:hypothetical protein
MPRKASLDKPTPPKKRKTKVDLVDETDDATSDTQQWIPTRAAMLKDNPYAHLSKEEAQALLHEATLRLRAAQQEERLLGTVVASYNTVYMLSDGSIHKAV